MKLLAHPFVALLAALAFCPAQPLEAAETEVTEDEYLDAQLQAGTFDLVVDLAANDALSPATSERR